MRKILITGGAGFVGRRFVRHFLEAGDEVHCVDPLLPGTGAAEPGEWQLFRPHEHAGFRFHREDCRSFFLRRQDTDFDYAFHLAAIVGGRRRIEGDPLAAAENLAIDAAYWRWAAAARPGKTICFSSSSVYPLSFQERGSYRLLEESMVDFGEGIGLPDAGYGWAKLTLELFTKLARERLGLPSVIYRPFSGYGEDQDDSYPFTAVCKKVLESRDGTVTVWGSGAQMRDFIHIDDCVRGVVSTMDKLPDGNALNLSSGRYTSFREFARLAGEILGKAIEVKGDNREPEGAFARAGSTAKQEKFGFRPEISLETGIARGLRHLEKKR